MRMSLWTICWISETSIRSVGGRTNTHGHSPDSPDAMDWSTHYPKYFSESSPDSAEIPKATKQVEWADVGCGFGGLLMSLAPQFPDTLMLGEQCTT